ncbi:MAG: leucyl aminopeptidase family protein [Steroidobacteraceae bacterium]
MFNTAPMPGSIPLHIVYEDQLESWLNEQPESARAWARASGFKAEKSRVLLIPDAAGGLVAGACGAGKRQGGDVLTLWHSAGIPERLPQGNYHLATNLDTDAARQFALGWAYGQYRFDRFKREGTSQPAKSVQLALPTGVDSNEVARLNAACTLARDLINTPASHLLPAELAAAVVEVAGRYGATVTQHSGDDLLRGFPAVHAVGRASLAGPRLIEFHWGNPAHPLVALVGKGVCFDSGGLDLKPPASMLMMKKDMGGAACVLALAQLVMDARLPVRLHVIIPAVENAVAGNAFRPGDVLATRKGLQVEVGNTDAEGRLVLADGLALADTAKPDLLIDLATLTGAARIALGPELPALFASDDEVAASLVRHGSAVADPLWQLPLWAGYDDELSSKIADLNNVSSSGFSGAIIGALFLKRFVAHAKHWVHIDLYGWNSRERPGRPVGGEAQGVRALYAYLQARYPA